VSDIAKAQGWRRPSYSTVYAILAALDPAMMTLAHEGATAFRDRYELIHRHRAAAPNALWQADHTLLDLLILDEAGRSCPSSMRVNTRGLPGDRHKGKKA
jgi:putative transposase